MDAISFAIAITFPNLFLIALGYFLKQQKQVNEAFISQASALVFNICLPSLLFFNVLNSKVDIAAQIPVLTAGIVTTLILFLGAEIYAYYFVHKPKDKGVFVQGVFRSNMAIIGLATIYNAYGEQGLGVGAVYMGVLTIIFNVLAVITLSRTDESNFKSNSINTKLKTLVKKITTNPLIISLVAAFAYKALPIAMPHQVIEKTGTLLANTALPLALICAGASLNVKSMLHPSGLSMQASIARIFIAPLIAIAIAIGLVLGLPAISTTAMGVLFLMVASPTAAASYVMAKAMGGNDVLAANILAFTTVFSMIGMGIGAGILRSMGLM